MFEKATRKKVRFTTAVGKLSVEDLWDIPLSSKSATVSLDNIAISLHKELEQSSVTSFVEDVKPKNELLQLKFDIVKHVIDVRKEERDAAKKAEEIKAKKEKIMEIIANKEDAELLEKSKEDLEKLLASL